jgi:hypothetical protein
MRFFKDTPKIFLFILICHSFCSAQINVLYPSSRIVIQRNNQNLATLFISGTFNQPIDKVEARLLGRANEGGISRNWMTIQNNPSDGIFTGSILQVYGGRYDLEVRGMLNNQVVGTTVIITKVGVGEVFLIVGHSNASGGSSPSVGATSDLVSSINWVNTDPNWLNYWDSANPALLPPLQFSQLCTNCGIAPGSGMPWFWGQLGDSLVEATQVPILFYSAAFGGSNMVQTYKAAYDIPFSHSFINYSLRHPYINTKNALQKYIPYTGVRAILSAHGINDRDEPFLATNDPQNPDFGYAYAKVIDKTRQDLGHPNLAWMVATSCWYNGIWKVDSVKTLLQVQDSLITNKPHVFRGGNLNLINNTGRTDGVHFNQLGQSQAAKRWKEAIMTQNQPSGTPNFINNSDPLLVTNPPVFFAKSITSGSWTNPSTWSSNAVPDWITNVAISSGNVVSLSATQKVQAKTLYLRGTLQFLNFLYGINLNP